MPESPKARIAIVAALEREVHPLVKTWRVCERQHGGRRFRFFGDDDVVVVCGGMGAECARRAAEAVIELYAPAVVYSVGFAGALDRNLKVGDVLAPQWVINAGDGSRMLVEAGQGVLVTFGAVANPAQKAKLHESYGAHAVDMEAAAVARAVELRGVAFGVVKAISDDCDFEFPSTERFVNADGEFLEMRFALYAAVRPWLWLKVMRLALNSSRAAKVLCACLGSLNVRDPKQSAAVCAREIPRPAGESAGLRDDAH
jgi:adenosylhomocysteine nucleosidase